MRKWVTKRNVLIVIGLGMVIGFWRINQLKKAGAGTSGTKVVEVSQGDVVASITSSGEVNALRTAVLNFPSPGKLSYLGVKEGDVVKRGQLLAALDLGDLQAQQTKAYYAYLAADANAKYIEDQVKGHDSDETFLQKTTRVTAQTTRDAAYDTWLSAERAVHNAQLFSPFDGIVTHVTATAIGDTVNITDGVSVIDPNSLYFNADVDESDVGKISVGLPVVVTLDAYDGQKFEGEVDEIGFVSNISSTGATVYPVRIKLTSDVSGKMRVGMNGDAEIITQTVKNVLYLPIEAVVDGNVNVSDGKSTKSIKIETGLVGSTDVEIKSGLKLGDKVIIK